MSRKNTWLVQVANLIGYLTLQLVINQAIASFHQACFVYIGFFLFLPWARNNMIWQLLLGFGVGLLVDVFYDSLGIHTFAAVLVLYLRNFLLYLLLPPGSSHVSTIRPTLRNMGTQKFALYVLFLATLYHIIVFTLDTYSLHFFFANLPHLLSSIMFSYLLIFLSRIFVGAMLSTRSK
jgi:hypothetical protein